MHFRQPRVQAGHGPEKTQQRRAVRGRRKEVFDAEPLGVLADEGERRVGDGALVVDGRLKRGEPRGGLDGGLPHVDEPDAVARAPEVEAGRHRRGLAHPRQRAHDDARVAEVVAHQPLDALLRKRAGIAEDVGGMFLQRMRQLVVVAFALEVKNRPHAQQKVLGLFDLRGIFYTAPRAATDR